MKVEEGRRVGQKRKAKRRRKGAEMGCGGGGRTAEGRGEGS